MILNLVSQISEIMGILSTTKFKDFTSPKLRRSNTLKTVQASCAIEGNELTLEQVTAIFEGKTVVGSTREIQEIKNALDLYENIDRYKSVKKQSLLQAHKTLMSGLINDAGQFRRFGVGIKKGEEILHLAPPAENVHALINDLLSWVETTDLHPLIVSSVFHYEFEFIHPFSDGNGRIGRFWQTLILKEWNPLFAYVHIETAVRNNQEKYYKALNISNSCGKSTPFIEFILDTIKITLENVHIDQVSDQVSDQVKELLEIIGGREISVAECMKKLKIKHRPTFRQNRLNPAIDIGLIEMTQPESPRSPSQKYRLTDKGKRMF